jgi:hypothetical protein
MKELAQPIMKNLELWNDGWKLTDSNAVLRLWDGRDKHPYFLSGNHIIPLTSFSAIKLYIEERCAYYDAIENRISGLIVKNLDRETMLTFYNLHWMETKKGKCMSGHVRTTVIWKHLKNYWKIFHYSEAPIAPLIALQNFYEGLTER